MPIKKGTPLYNKAREFICPCSNMEWNGTSKLFSELFLPILKPDGTALERVYLYCISKKVDGSVSRWGKARGPKSVLGMRRPTLYRARARTGASRYIDSSSGP